jgi:hypothetical protein
MRRPSPCLPESAERSRGAAEGERMRASGLLECVVQRLTASSIQPISSTEPVTLCVDQ